MEEVGIGKVDEVADPVPLTPADELASVTGVTNGLGDRELENPAPLGLRPRFNDPRGRPRLDDDVVVVYCWSRERTEKYGVVIWAWTGSKENLWTSTKTNNPDYDG